MQNSDLLLSHMVEGARAKNTVSDQNCIKEKLGNETRKSLIEVEGV